MGLAHSSILANTLIAVALIAMAASSAYSLALTGEIPYEGEPRILDPTYAAPLFAEPGSGIGILVWGSFKPEDVYLESLDGKLAIRLELDSVEPSRLETLGYEAPATLVKARIPSGAPEGLYNVIVAGSGRELWSPRSVYIYASPPGELTILHISDIHLGASAKGVPNDFKNTRYIALINTLAEQAGVDLVVVTGDNADIGSDVASYRAFYFQMNQLLVPTLVVPGNHDWAQVNSVELYTERFMGRYVTPLRLWHRVYGPFLIIGLDSRSEGYLTMEELDYLESVLASHSDKVAIIAMHHPFFSRAGDYSGGLDEVYRGLYGSWRDHREEAERFLDIINKYSNVALVLAGHIHRDADAVYTRSDGSKVYFIATTTANHSLPEGYWWGAKIVRITVDGSVAVDTLGAPYEPTHGSINTEEFHVYQVVGGGLESAAWIFDTNSFTGYSVDLSRALLVFPLAASSGEPRVYVGGDRILEFITYETGRYVLVVALADITGSGKIVVAYKGDEEPPTVRVESLYPSRPRVDRPIIVKLTAVDEGWGLESVTYTIALDGRVVEEGSALRGLKPGEYTVRFVPAQPGTYTVAISAVDLAGNRAEATLEITVESPGAAAGQAGTTMTATTGPATGAPEEASEATENTATPAAYPEEGEGGATGAATAGQAAEQEGPGETVTVARPTGAGEGAGLLLVAAALSASLMIIAAAVRAKRRA